MGGRVGGWGSVRTQLQALAPCTAGRPAVTVLLAPTRRQAGLAWPEGWGRPSFFWVLLSQTEEPATGWGSGIQRLRLPAVRSR